MPKRIRARAKPQRTRKPIPTRKTTRAPSPGPRKDGYSVSLTVNGRPQERTVEARLLLVDFLRDDLHLTGAHVGCDTSHCGACTVLVDGMAVKSCTMFAVQADGSEVVTIEGLTSGGRMSPVQEAFKENNGLQCGYCTPGVVLAATAFLRDHPNPTEDEIRVAISGNLCRCTGYRNIVQSIAAAASRMGAGPG